MADMDRLLMLTNAVAPDKLGGLERYVRELSAELVRQGLSVTVLTKRVTPTDPSEEMGADGVIIHRHSVPNKSNPTFALRYPFYVASGVLHGLRQFGPQATIHGQYAITTLPLALARRPYVYTFQAPVHKELLLERGETYALPRVTQKAAVRGLRVAERLVVDRATRTVVLSEFMRSELNELSPEAALKSQLIPGGIDTSQFCPGPVNRDAWAIKARPLLFAARRLVARTGVIELVKAMPDVLNHFPSVRLAIAGDGNERQAIEHEILRLGLDKNIRLLGRISDKELLQWYRNADLTITPTQLLEGFGLATGESLAVGTPAVVTPVGSNPELVQDLHPFLVAPGKRPADIASAISRLLGEPELLGNLRSQARAHAHPRWSWETVANRYIKLYRELYDPSVEHEASGLGTGLRPME